MLVQIGNRDIGSLAGERERDRAADSAVCAGHERDATFHAAEAAIRVLTEVGLRLHVRLAAGMFLFVLVEGRLGSLLFRVVGAHAATSCNAHARL